MKKVIITLVTVLVALSANAKATLSGPEDGIISINIENAGDLNSFNFNTLTAAQKAVTSFYITGNLNQNDWKALNNNFTVKSLDLTDATSVGDTWVFQDGNYKFRTTLESFTFPKYLTTVDGQWINQTNVKKVIIPNGTGNGSSNVTVTGFGSMKKLESVIIGKGVTEIGNSAFQEISTLKELDIRAGVKKIGQSAFVNCPIEDIVLPEGLIEIGQNAFCNAKVSSLHLPSTLKTINSNAFMNCDNLTSITIPANVEYIGAQAFKGKNISDVYVLGENTKAARDAFDPGNTYDNVTYTQNGEVDRTDWTGRDNLHPAILHYPAAAREKYLNGRILNAQDYPSYYKDGVKYPVTFQDWGTNTLNSNTDYLGWQQFMLTEQITDDEVFTIENIIDDTWYTMCFPFDLTVSQLFTAFGEFTEVCEFVKAEVNDVEGGKAIDFQFKRWIGKDKNSNEIVTKANVPYMIHPNLGVECGSVISRSIIIAGINKLPAEQQTPWKEEYYKRGEDGNYIFVGNYKKQAIPQYAYFLGMKDGEVKFFKQMAAADQSRNSGLWNPYTAIIMTDAEFEESTNFWTCGNDGVSETSTIISAKIIDDDVTLVTNGIDEVKTDSNVKVLADNMVRNINGQVVRRGTTSLEGLQKGLYIVNGKKYMVK